MTSDTGYRCGDEETLMGTPVYVTDRMTDDEMRRFLGRAERLLDELDGYPVDAIHAYGSQGRVGVRVKPGHDPLRNGVLTGTVDGFHVEAVSPINTEWVSIRFQAEDIDTATATIEETDR